MNTTKYKLKEEYQKGRNSYLWELETLKSEWEMHITDFPTFGDYLNLYDQIEETNMSHYEEFHEKKAIEESQRNVFKQEDSPGEAVINDVNFAKEWAEFCDKYSRPLFEDKDPVNHPKHYCTHPSGVECIQITEHLNFCLGNAIKYLWRAGIKTENSTEDLKKAVWYIQRELKRIGGDNGV